MRLPLAALALAVFSLNAAQAAEDPVKLRQEGFKSFKSHFGAMRKMLEGKLPYDALKFQEEAKALQSASAALWGGLDRHFPKGSLHEDSAALPAIWDNWSEFEGAAKKNREAVDALAASASGQPALDALKTPMGAVGQSCKGCHEQFKGD